MTKTMGPHEIAAATGVSTDTLRHYERKGLLPGIRRGANGYRRYPAEIVPRVRLIQRALVIGFSLEDLQRVLAVRDAGGAPCRTVRALVGERLDALTRRIEELLALRDELRVIVGEWDGRLDRTPGDRPAHLLEGLGANAAIERAVLHRTSATAVRTRSAPSRDSVQAKTSSSPRRATRG
jgi:DNA-binding transcriptional MerR regulator